MSVRDETSEWAKERDRVRKWYNHSWEKEQERKREMRSREWTNETFSGQRNEKFILCGHYSDYLRLLLLAIFCPNLYLMFSATFNIINILKRRHRRALVDFITTSQCLVFFFSVFFFHSILLFCIDWFSFASWALFSDELRYIYTERQR